MYLKHFAIPIREPSLPEPSISCRFVTIVVTHFRKENFRKLTTKWRLPASLWTKQIEGSGALPSLPEAAREKRGRAYGV